MQIKLAKNNFTLERFGFSDIINSTFFLFFISMKADSQDNQDKYKGKIFKNNLLLVSLFKAFVVLGEKPGSFRKLLLNVRFGEKSDINDVVGDFDFPLHSEEYRKAVRLYVEKIIGSLDNCLRDDSEENLLKFYNLGKTIFYDENGEEIVLGKEEKNKIGFELALAMNIVKFSKKNHSSSSILQALDRVCGIEKIHEDSKEESLLSENKFLFEAITKNNNDAKCGMFFLFFLAELKKEKPAFLSILKSFYCGLIENKQYLEMISSGLIFSSDLLEMTHFEPTIRHPVSIQPKILDFLLFREQEKLNQIKKKCSLEGLGLFEASLNLPNLNDGSSAMLLRLALEANNVFKKQFYPPIIDKINLLSAFFEAEKKELSKKEKEAINAQSKRLLFSKDDLKIEKAKENDSWHEEVIQTIFDQILGVDFDSNLEKFITENEEHDFVKNIAHSLTLDSNERIKKDLIDELFCAKYDVDPSRNAEPSRTNKGVFYYFFKHKNNKKLLDEYANIAHFLIEHNENKLIKAVLKKIFISDDQIIFNFIRRLEKTTVLRSSFSDSDKKNQIDFQPINIIKVKDFLKAFPIIEELVLEKINKKMNALIIGKRVNQKKEISNFNQCFKFLVDNKNKSLPSLENKIFSILDLGLSVDKKTGLNLFKLGEGEYLEQEESWKRQDVAKIKETLLSVFEKIKIYSEIEKENDISVSEKTKKTNFRF